MNTNRWTPTEKLEALMRLPWSINIELDPTDGSLVAQVGEIPDAIATGATMKELGQDLYESLSASLELRIEHGDPIAMPQGLPLPWEESPAGPVGIRTVSSFVRQRMGDILVRPYSSGVSVSELSPA